MLEAAILNQLMNLGGASALGTLQRDVLTGAGTYIAPANLLLVTIQAPGGGANDLLGGASGQCFVRFPVYTTKGASILYNAGIGGNGGSVPGMLYGTGGNCGPLGDDGTGGTWIVDCTRIRKAKAGALVTTLTTTSSAFNNVPLKSYTSGTMTFHLSTASLIKFDGELGSITTLSGGGVGGRWILGVDSNGFAYGIDSSSKLYKVNTATGVGAAYINGNGASATGADTDGTGNAAVPSWGWNDWGVNSAESKHALAPDGTIYMVSRAGTGIRKIAPGGVVSLFVGDYAATGATDATGTSARFTQIRALCLHSDGNLYALEAKSTGTGSIRKITPGGVVTTVFNGGSVSSGGPVDGNSSTGKLFDDGASYNSWIWSGPDNDTLWLDLKTSSSNQSVLGLRKFTISAGALSTVDTTGYPWMLLGDRSMILADSATPGSITQYRRATVSGVAVQGGALGSQSNTLATWLDGPSSAIAAGTGETATFGDALSVPGGAAANGLSGTMASVSGTTPPTTGLTALFGTFKVASAAYGGGCDIRSAGADTRYGASSFLFNVTPPGSPGLQGAGGGSGTAAKFTSGNLPPAKVMGFKGGDGIIIVEWFQ